MVLRARRCLLVARPSAVPGDDCFAFDEVEVRPLREGEALVRNLVLALDPAIRGWMNDSRASYMPPIALGDPVRSGNVSEVLESRIPGIEPGQLHQTLAAWETHSILDARGFHGRVEASPELPIEKAIHLLGGSGLTAYFGLFEIGRPKPGETVVVSAASGSVGTLVGQLAKAHGCRVVGITGTREKAAWLVSELGFDAAVAHAEDDLRAGLKAACPKGVDVFFDSVGGEILDTVLTRLAVHARIVLCGAISQLNLDDPPPGPRNYVHLLAKRARMEGFVTIDFAARYPEARTRLAELTRAGSLVVHQDVARGLDAAPAHFRRLFDGSHRGKLMISLAEPKGQ